MTLIEHDRTSMAFRFLVVGEPGDQAIQPPEAGDALHKAAPRPQPPNLLKGRNRMLSELLSHENTLNHVDADHHWKEIRLDSLAEARKPRHHVQQILVQKRPRLEVCRTAEDHVRDNTLREVEEVSRIRSGRDVLGDQDVAASEGPPCFGVHSYQPFSGLPHGAHGRLEWYPGYRAEVVDFHLIEVDVGQFRIARLPKWYAFRMLYISSDRVVVVRVHVCQYFGLCRGILLLR